MRFFSPGGWVIVALSVGCLIVAVLVAAHT
jgi:hypothetical protein